VRFPMESPGELPLEAQIGLRAVSYDKKQCQNCVASLICLAGLAVVFTVWNKPGNGKLCGGEIWYMQRDEAAGDTRTRVLTFNRRRTALKCPAIRTRDVIESRRLKSLKTLGNRLRKSSGKK